ncbi:hypothetical protein Tsubulata_033315 [Turnera subulata]|uniref:Peptidase C1A papain C-terminal domain-containing protein n=1 Tax=Turnera subulata TaxID=218843 RepID=A0A9Q0FQR2_9ROSI|nr:hypothetical protein Tsubulata_033315 [Turnera subulata]
MEALHKGPVVGCLDVSEDFHGLARGAIYQGVAEEEEIFDSSDNDEPSDVDAHAICITGYYGRGLEGYFRCLNSWGKWCDRGFCKISKTAFYLFLIPESDTKHHQHEAGVGDTVTKHHRHEAGVGDTVTKRHRHEAGVGDTGTKHHRHEAGVGDTGTKHHRHEAGVRDTGTKHHRHEAGVQDIVFQAPTPQGKGPGHSLPSTTLASPSGESAKNMCNP